MKEKVAGDLDRSIERWKTENPELAPYFDAQCKKFKAAAELQRLKRTIKKMVFLVDKLNKETSEWKESTIPMRHLDRFIMAFEEIVYMNITKEDRDEWDD
jgi:hypothetical protein